MCIYRHIEELAKKERKEGEILAEKFISLTK